MPLVFVDKLPVAPAAVDGIAGKFEIDTGSSAALALRRKFVEQHGFEDRYPGGLRMKSGGVDGGRCHIKQFYCRNAVTRLCSTFVFPMP